MKQPFYPTVAVVTGAGSGIGRGTAKALAARGANVVVADLVTAAAEETVAIITAAGGQAAAYTVDVADTPALAAFAEQVAIDHGVPDVVVNNAGIMVGGPFLEIPLQDVQRIIDINLMAMIHGCRIFGAQMVERGRGGHLANISSLAAFGPARLTAPYSISKYAVKHFGDCLRAEFAQHNIGVTTICPGLIATNLADTARISTVDDQQLDVGKTLTRRAMAAIGTHPDKAGEIIVDAISKNRAIRPIRAEAHAAYAINRLSPRAWRGLVRLVTGPEIEQRGRTLLDRYRGERPTEKEAAS